MSTTQQPAKPKPIAPGELLILLDHFRREAAEENGTIAGRLRAHKIAQLLEEVEERRIGVFIDTKAIEKRMRDRCFHGFLEFIDAAQSNAPSDAARAALIQFGAAMTALGADGLGEGACDCGEPNCPYREEAANA